MAFILGLDIGGANIKGCWLEVNEDRIHGVRGNSVYHEMWNNPDGMRDILAGFNNSFKLRKSTGLDAVALTMTAELCDGFELKAQAVISILNIVQEVFADIPVYVWTIRETFVEPSKIRQEPLLAAAANWLASAAALAHSPLPDDHPVILADMGSTTTDIVPVAPGKVLAKGKTDTERLTSGELLYTGTLRTAVSSILDGIYLDGSYCRTANEVFAVSADVYRLLGWITEKQYDIATPDRKSTDPEACAKRLARVVASEPEELGMKNIYLMARAVMEKQISLIVNNILQVVSRNDILLPKQLVTTGQGSFILAEAARRLGWSTTPWWKIIPGGKPQAAMSSYAVAWLLSQHYKNKEATGH